jgi:hypothetical protein
LIFEGEYKNKIKKVKEKNIIWMVK